MTVIAFEAANLLEYSTFEKRQECLSLLQENRFLTDISSMKYTFIQWI